MQQEHEADVHEMRPVKLLPNEIAAELLVGLLQRNMQRK
jgi:hypothetical protein